ncbi:hypothetical protein Ddc_08417 [Ditylenchus destructor]|nr:hypothetical protein Ddc_08417 [Ditylenchus destructor]
MNPTTPAEDISFGCVKRCILQVCIESSEPKHQNFGCVEGCMQTCTDLPDHSTFWIIWFSAMFLIFVLIPIGLVIYCTVKHCRKSKKDKRNPVEDREKCHTWTTPSLYSEASS